MSVLHDPRLRQLLAEVDNAQALIAQQGDPTGEVAEALDSLYRDLGRHLHTCLRVEPDTESAPEPSTSEVSFVAKRQTDAQPQFESDGWYTDEIDGDSLPLFTEGDLGDGIDETDVPDPDSQSAPRVSRVDPDEVDIVSLADLRADAVSPDGELARLRIGREVPAWAEPFAEFVELLTPPDDLLASSAMPEEASQVQWAAGAVAERLPGWPTTVQLAILGMLSARALNLAAHLDVDVGPRRALDRLKRYRDDLDLPFVAGLLPGSHPECDTWAEDAMAFWALLRPNS